MRIFALAFMADVATFLNHIGCHHTGSCCVLTLRWSCTSESYPEALLFARGVPQATCSCQVRSCGRMMRSQDALLPSDSLCGAEHCQADWR